MQQYPRKNKLGVQFIHERLSNDLLHIVQMIPQDLLLAQSHLCPCRPTPRPETHPPAGTSLSALAASGLLWSSTAQGRGLALRYELSGSTWETVMSTLFTTWSGYVFSSQVQLVVLTMLTDLECNEKYKFICKNYIINSLCGLQILRWS